MAGLFIRKYKYYLVILAGVIAGTLLANLIITDITDKIGVFNSDFNNALANVTPDRTLYLRYVFKQRIKEYIILWLVAFTPAAWVGAYTFMIFAGMSTGVMVSVCVMNMGLMGINMYTLGILPQYIIYAIAVSFIMYYIKQQHIGVKKTAIIVMLSLISLIIGILYETYASTWLIGKLLQHISYCI